MRDRRIASRSSCSVNRRAAGGSSSAPSRSVSAAARIEAAGVFSSWEAFATKSRRTASSRRASVTSRTTSRTEPSSPTGSRRRGASAGRPGLDLDACRARRRRGSPRRSLELERQQRIESSGTVPRWRRERGVREDATPGRGRAAGRPPPSRPGSGPGPDVLRRMIARSPRGIPGPRRLGLHPGDVAAGSYPGRSPVPATAPTDGRSDGDRGARARIRHRAECTSVVPSAFIGRSPTLPVTVPFPGEEAPVVGPRTVPCAMRACSPSRSPVRPRGVHVPRSPSLESRTGQTIDGGGRSDGELPEDLAGSRIARVSCARRGGLQRQLRASTGASGGGDLSGSLEHLRLLDRPADHLARRRELPRGQPGRGYRVDGPGTGDGFVLFCKGETDINDASRQIEDDEAQPARRRDRLRRARGRPDGITVMTTPRTRSTV